MKSLWKLTEERKQPEIQIMDQETLDTIKKFKPNFSQEYKKITFNKTDLELVLEYLPQQSWYLLPDISKSIHGISHAIRVMVYCCILLDCDRDMKRSLLFACAMHDTQRKNDGGDEDHEKRSLEWFKKFFSDHPLFMETYEILEGKHYFSKYLRTADALDRYRLAKVKWWIDDSYLSITPSDSIKEFAFDLVIKSEQSRLNGLGDIEAVISNLLVN